MTAGKPKVENKSVRQLLAETQSELGACKLQAAHYERSFHAEYDKRIKAVQEIGGLEQRARAAEVELQHARLRLQDALAMLNRARGYIAGSKGEPFEHEHEIVTGSEADRRMMIMGQDR